MSDTLKKSLVYAQMYLKTKIEMRQALKMPTHEQEKELEEIRQYITVLIQNTPLYIDKENPFLYYDASEHDVAH